MLRLIFAALILVPMTLPAQGAESKPIDPLAAKTPAIVEAVDYQIKVAIPYVVPGENLQVSYSIQVNKDTEIHPSILCGSGIDLYVGGQKIGAVIEAPAGEAMLPVRKGMSFEGKLPLTVNDLVRKSGLKLTKTDSLELALGFGPKARAMIKVVPDMSDFPLDKLDLTKTEVVIFTDFGLMVAQFFPDKAPNHVNRFVGLAQKHFYDGIQFHRIVPGFMVQGGDYHTRAPGSPSDMGAQPAMKAEFNEIKHVKGILSMARTNDPNSASAQFFLMHGRAPYLDNNYTVFGKIIKGLDVIDKLASQPVGRGPGGEVSRPLKPVWIRKIIVLGVPKK